tara:strand:+ start:844 stop:1365 length:522 start_codon:yes stop_codon:yes gene_type:complete
MMTDDTYTEWARRHPQAAYELQAIQLAGVMPPAKGEEGHSEDWAQAQVRMAVARAGGLAWRNNVGANKTKEVHVCPACAFRFEVTRPPLRWGLCNDSAKLNKVMKSSDLIGGRPIVITPSDVGRTILQFFAIEMKKPGWSWSGDSHEQAQAAYGSLVMQKHGFFAFSTGALPW